MKIQHPIFLKATSILVTVVAAAVMFGWIFDYEPVLSLIPGAATMKANTALCFILLGLSGICFHRMLTASKVLAMLTAVVAVLTLLDHLAIFSFGLDELIVQDSYSSITKSRMSPATAICFLFISVGLLLINKRQKMMQMVAQNIWLAVTIIAFISIVAYLLSIPAEEKTELFSSMAIHTSLLFALLSLGLFFQTSSTGFAALISGSLPGSKIIRQLLPFIILLPLVLNYLFFVLSVSTSIDVQSNFWLIINTITLTLLSILYISIVAIGLNKSANKEARLQVSLRNSNRSLGAFKQAVDRISMVSLIDGYGNFLEVNKNFTEITGYSSAEIIGKRYDTVLFDKTQVASIIDQLQTTGLWEGEIECMTKDDRHYWVHSTIVKNNVDDSSTTEFLVLEQDITSRKEIEQMRNTQFVQKLQQKNEELEQFLYIASHDLQEPLRSISGMIELLKLEMDGQLNETTLSFFQLIEGSSTRMSDLIKGLMDYARLGGKREFKRTDLNNLLGEVLLDIRDRLERNNVKLITHPLPNLEVYKVEMRLLFQNLISNAIKFKKPDEDPVVEIKAEENDNFWKFEVKDNGIGIKEPHLEKVFIIFQRLHKKSEFEGTGIGLAHCKKIITLHGGEIWVESTINKGSSFFFTIPKEQFKVE